MTSDVDGRSVILDGHSPYTPSHDRLQTANCRILSQNVRGFPKPPEPSGCPRIVRLLCGCGLSRGTYRKPTSRQLRRLTHYVVSGGRFGVSILTLFPLRCHFGVSVTSILRHLYFPYPRGCDRRDGIDPGLLVFKGRSSNSARHDDSYRKCFERQGRAR